jgi:carbon-monoxide dehydrogenase medium subunit
MRRWRAYHTPTTVAEALSLLHQHKDKARIIAGGTDLILDMEAEHTAAPEVLVDVTKIAGIDRIAQEDGWIVLGAGITHTQIENSPLLHAQARCLTESCGVIGGPQVRNVATLGGNVAHALPAADGTIGLLALEAEVEVAGHSAMGANSAAARRGDGTSGGFEHTWQPLLSIFAGPGRNRLAPDQMLHAFRFRPTAARAGNAFDRIMRPQGVALPVLAIAARVQLDATLRRVEDAVIAIGPAGPTPFRASGAEEALTAAKVFDDAAVENAVAAAQAQARLRTSKYRASQEYRREMIGVLLKRVLQAAVERARMNVAPAEPENA